MGSNNCKAFDCVDTNHCFSLEGPNKETWRNDDPIGENEEGVN